MKKRLFVRIISLVLCLGMTVTTAQAAGNGWGIFDWIRSRVEQVIGGWTDPGQGDTGAEEPGSEDSDLTLIEDDTTVTNGDMLRASTYALSDGTSVQADSGTTLKYFPVTLYDYDTDTINNATHRADLEANASLTEWKGIYFSGGNKDDLGNSAFQTYSYTTSNDSHTNLTWQQVINGTYYSDEACNTQVTVETQTGEGYAVATGVVIYSEGFPIYNSSWVKTSYYYFSDSDNSYYPLYGNRSSYQQISTDVYGYVYTWGYSKTDSSSDVVTITTQKVSYGNLTTEAPNVTLYTNSGVVTGYILKAGNDTLATLDSTDTTQKVGVTLYTKAGTSSVTATYAAWNWWNKASGIDSNGQKFYTGLMESTLAANKDPVFTVPDGGIFNSDTTVKEVYTNVEMPFVYKKDMTFTSDGKEYTSNFYVFDAATNGVYFHEDTAQGSSGSAASNTRLYFDSNSTQSHTDMNYGDGSKTLWAPFNKDTSFSVADMDYHFGMRATIPFTMTSNGRMSENDENSAPIQFSFSGDDDVWVFIDGQLVIDLGGIHNRLDVEIDFAANTVTYSANNDAKDDTTKVMFATGSYNDSNFSLSQTLFTTEKETGLISQNRETFSASETHELTVFYLERGKGSSNCKISFNLPMKDTLTVTKRANRSWNKNAEEGEDPYDPLTAKEQAAVDNISFGFTLYKSTNGGNTFETVSNAKFKVLDKDGQVVDTRSTDANGHFYLRNNNSARFVTDFGSDGVTYYVVEDDMSSSGFVTPDFTYSGTAAGGFNADNQDYTSGSAIPKTELDVEAEENKSRIITVYGSDESEDSLVFVCENFLDATMPNPSARPSDDKIVIDYGLGVDINVLVNDVYRGDSIEILGVYGNGVVLTETAKADQIKAELNINDIVSAPTTPEYGTATLNGDGTIHYQLTQQLTGVEVLTYLVKVTGSAEQAGGNTVKAYAYGLAHVYIIPATIMYYEEDFTGLVTYKDGKSSGWTEVGTPETANQEPGVVGTYDDSPYGSDVAYLSDSGDSNGSSMYVNTTNGAAQFSYTFTGTGTSFFARTTIDSGYMRVVVKNEAGDTVQALYRDTKWMNSTESGYTLDGDEALYNIPVFTTTNLDYGTYTVTVTIAKAASNVGYGSKFWLDGIRVYMPLAEADENHSVATSAYASDGEANMTNVTLRQKIISDADVDEDGKLVYSENFAVLTDNDGKIQTVEQYESDGPKEEVYLYDGQTISFSLEGWDPNTNKLYLGMKAPTGSATVTVGSQTITLNNAADCYYEISSYATIAENEDGVKIATFTIKAGEGTLVSVTNIKVTGDAKFCIIPEDNKNFEGVTGDDDVTVDGNDAESEEDTVAADETSGSDDET